jgi:hypothetical protein
MKFDAPFSLLYTLSKYLQGWVFAMRYFQSATECALTETCLTTRCVKYTGWVVGLVYAAAVTLLYAWIIISFPGIFDSNWSTDPFIEWAYGPQSKLYLSLTAISSAFTIASTTISIFAICKIFAINKHLSLTNPNVEINNKTMVLHSTLLVIEYCATLLSNI